MDKTRYIVAGSLVDGSGAAVRRHVFLQVEDGFITAIGAAEDLPAGDRAVADDLSRCTIVPPLVDCSVSLSRSPSVDEKVRLAMTGAGPAEKKALAARHIRYCYGHGVLGVAANDDDSDLVDDLQELMPAGSSIDIRAAGRDFLRIEYSPDMGGEEGFGSRFDRHDLARIIEQNNGKKAVVSANGAGAVEEALAAGCDAIEQGYAMGEENLRQMAETDVLWIPCVLMAKNAWHGAGSGGEVSCRFSMRYVAPGKADPGAAAFWKRMLAEQLAQLRLAKNLGVKTALGTGAGRIGILHGESMVEEMKLFIRAGWSLEETIRCASEIGAGFFGMENPGELAVGRRATFLVARGAAQQLPRKLAYLENIYVDGAPGIAWRNL